MKNNLLSVIVLVYKQKEKLLETLDSVFMQNYPEIELIISEDSSGEFDKSFVEKYIDENKRENIVNVIFNIQEKNVGTVKNINSAIKISNGEFIKIIAGDDTYPPDDVFSNQVKGLRENPDKLFAVGNIAECDFYMNQIKINGFYPDGEMKLLQNPKKLIRYICKKNAAIMATQSCCFRKEFFEKVGLYDERCRLIEDLPMAVKTISSDIFPLYINETSINHRGSGGVSTSANAFDQRRIAYYNDLKTYYETSLFPIKKLVGRAFVNMRYKLICFRIAYSDPEISNFRKISLLFKYCVPIMYYILSKTDRFIFYLKGNRK